MRDWNYDGLKLDGQHMNGVPPCFNPAHHHARPEESVEDLAKFFQMIYDTARSIKPDAIVEWCPCGTAFNFYNLPNLNMSVASDPKNSWQVRTKGKSLKAMTGDTMAYFGDRHVELSDGKSDFASTLRGRRRGGDAVHMAGGFQSLRPAQQPGFDSRKAMRDLAEMDLPL